MSKQTEEPKSRFATVYGSPGQRPRTLGPLRVFWPLVPICVAAGYLLRAALPMPAISTTQAGFLFLALAIALIVFTLWSAKRLQSFLKGAEGEERVARTLSYLPAGYSVFNDVQLGESDFDHIVLSPAGLFVIETKNWSGEISFQHGKVFYNGMEPNRSPLKQVKDEAAALLHHLHTSGCPEAPVFPVLCFVGGRLPDEPSNIGGVRICTERDLQDLFENTLETPLPSGVLTIIQSELAKAMSEE